MIESIATHISSTGVLVLLWAALIAALFFVTRGLSRSLAWAFVAVGLVAPTLVLQAWSGASGEACTDRILENGRSVDGRYAYRIVRSTCRGTSETAFRVDMGRTSGDAKTAELRPVMRAYGFPKPVAVRQIAANDFLIFLASNGRIQKPVQITLDPETGAPRYVHRFFQGHQDDEFMVSRLSSRPEAGKAKDCDRQRHSQGRSASRPPASPSRMAIRGSSDSENRWKLSVRDWLLGG